MQLIMKFKYKVGGIKMLDKIAMITFLVVYIICLFVALLMYLVIRGADICKTDDERFDEDEEQMMIVSKIDKNGGKSSE